MSKDLIKYGDLVRIKKSGTDKYLSVCGGGSGGSGGSGLTLSSTADDLTLFHIGGGVTGAPIIISSVFTLQSSGSLGTISYSKNDLLSNCPKPSSLFITKDNSNPDLVSGLGLLSPSVWNTTYNTDFLIVAVLKLHPVDTYITTCDGPSCSNELGLTYDRTNGTKWVFTKATPNTDIDIITNSQSWIEQNKWLSIGILISILFIFMIMLFLYFNRS
jgi:hypothetical protein